MVLNTHLAPEPHASQLSEIAPSSTSTLNIHPDFISAKEQGFSLDGWAITLKSSYLRAMNLLYRRKFRRLMSEMEIPGPDGNPLSLVIIRPDGLPPRSPALIYYHGGAFSRTHFPQHLGNAVRYSLEARCVVIFARYRLAPRYPFPAEFNDCYSVLRWVMSNPEHLEIDRARVVVGGDGAGAALAAAVTRKAVQAHKIKLCAQVLIYPMGDARRETQVAVAAASGSPYLGTSHAATLGTCLRVDQGKLTGLPPAYLELAEFDIMHDEGKVYAEAMRSSGVEVELNEVKGAIHMFDLLVPESEISKAAVDNRIRFLRSAFAGPICPTFRTRRSLASQSVAQRHGDVKSVRS